MNLRDLDAQFLRVVDKSTMEFHPELAGADGIRFLCPKCIVRNGGAAGTHVILCWFTGKVPDERSPRGARWTPKGKGLDDLSFVPDRYGTASVRVDVDGGCGCHVRIENGQVILT